MRKWVLLGLPHLLWLFAFVYLYNSKGHHHINYDTLSVALTSLEVILVFFGLAGFGYIAIIAEKKATITAEQVVKSNIEEYCAREVQKRIEPTITKMIRENSELREALGVSKNDFSDSDMSEMIQAFDKEDKDENK